MPDATADVTVVVTSYNHQAYVEQCLDSIATQSSPPRQVVIVDDRSTDESAVVIADWLQASDLGWTFLAHSENTGVCAAMNEALALVATPLYCHISADDWMEGSRLERQVGALSREGDDIALLASDIREVDGGGVTLAVHDIGARLRGLTGFDRRDALHLALLERNILPAPGMLVRTQAVRDVGGYDESLSFEDYDMWLRLTVDHGLAYEPGIVSDYRFLMGGLTRSTQRQIAFLRTERRCLTKQSGRTAEADEVIRGRVRAIDEGLAGLEAQAETSSSSGTAASSAATLAT